MRYIDYGDMIHDIQDDKWIPKAPGNRDYDELIESGAEIVPYEPPPPTLEEAKIAKANEIADARWQDEVGGIVVGGVKMYTDRDSQAKYTGAVVTYNMRGTWPQAWKGMDGWLPLPTGDDLLDLADAVEQHVQSLYLKEGMIDMQIKAAQTVEEVQAISWDM